MFFPLAEWTESGGEKTFVHTTAKNFQGIGVGLLVLILVYRRFKLSRKREYLK